MLFVAATVSNGHNALYLVLSAFISVGIVGMLWCMRAGLAQEDGLVCEVPDDLYAETPVEVTIRCRWVSRWSALPLRLRWPWGEEVEVQGQTRESVTVMVPRRGLYPCREVAILIRGPFGLFESLRRVPARFYRASGHVANELIVFPRVRGVTAEELDRARQTPMGDQRLAEPTRDLAGIRMYRPGDEPRTIHWKASAKLSKLVVKEFDARGTMTITVRVQSDLAGSRLEEEVCRVASLAAALLDQGAFVRVSFGDQVTPYGGGRPHLKSLLLWLATHP